MTHPPVPLLDLKAQHATIKDEVAALKVGGRMAVVERTRG